MAVVDASVVISAILPGETHHNASKLWFDKLVNSGQHFTAPAVLLSEVAAPLSRAYNQPDLANNIIQILMTAPFSKLVPVSVPLANRAADIALKYKIRGCDAVYVALAETLGEELITLDQQQSERAKTIVLARRP
jgi:predicted nucleic acid-binding protein